MGQHQERKEQSRISSEDHKSRPKHSQHEQLRLNLPTHQLASLKCGISWNNESIEKEKGNNTRGLIASPLSPKLPSTIDLKKALGKPSVL